MAVSAPIPGLRRRTRRSPVRAVHVDAGGRAHADWYRAAAIALITFGVALRLLLFFRRPSLWLDEAMVALNVGSRSFGGLGHPLDFDQTAPIPFLWATKAATLLLGMNEWGLRLVPLLASLGVLILIWPAARRLVGDEEALLTTAFASCSILLLTYAGEAKQYGVDGFVTAGLLALVAPLLADASRTTRWRYLGAGGMVALWCSMPAVFTLAGIAVALAVDQRIRGDRRRLRRLVVVCGSWAATFVVLYVFVYRSAMHDPYLRRFWEPTFFTVGAADAARRITDGLYQALASPFLSELGVPDHEGALLLLGVGLWAVGVAAAWYAHGPPMGLLLIVPYLAAFGASAAGLYPIAARMQLFATPFLYLAGASAVLAAVELWPRAWRPAVYGAALLAFLLARAPRAAGVVLGPQDREESRGLVQALDRGGPDPVYLFASGVPAWLFYTTDWHAPDTARLHWYARVAGSAGPAFANAPSRAPRSIHDGDGLTYTYHGRREIVGVGDGMEYRGGLRFLQPWPDPGWASAEAARLRAATDSTASIFASHFTPAELGPLLAAIWHLGGVVEEARAERSAAVYRIRFPAQRERVTS